MVTILPIGALSMFAPVVGLGGAPGKLHASGDLSLPLVRHQQVNMIGRNDVVQHTQSVAFPGFEQPTAPRPPIPKELEQELLPMTTVGDVPGVAGQVKTVGSWHAVPSLEH